MARSAPADAPKESATMASMRTRGDGPLPDDETLPVATETVDAEIIADSAETTRAVEPYANRSTLAEASQASEHPAMVHLNRWLAENRARVDDPEMAVADIIGQVLNAKSVDEVLSDVELPGLRENLDRPFIMYGAKVNQSSFEAGAPYYFVCDVEWLDTGVRGMVTSGAQSVIAQIMRLIELDALPTTMKAVYATKEPTKNGFRPYKLVGIK